MTRKLSKNNHLLIRSTLIMLFVLSCAFVAILLMGKAYVEMQKILFNNDTQAFFIVEKDVFSVLGKEFYIPIISCSEKVASFLKNFASGIIKLIGYVLNLTNELIEKIIILLSNSIVS